MKVAVFGGAGFIGGHVCARYAEQGHDVVAFDNFSRKGARENAAWLCERHPRLAIVEGDIRSDHRALDACVQNADLIFHMAGQVAVTTSVKDPRDDFETNAAGTFNLLEAVRRNAPRAIMLYASTNKVYGKMEHVPVVDQGARYAYADCPDGIAETQPLDFYSPYGCSKGCGDQYVHDYARIYGLNTIVFRQSCIYGTRQYGIEDQGWVAWFTIAALFGKQITIYGDGKQVRDVLYIDDLLDAYQMAIDRIDVARGRIYNIGGGPAHTLSLLELIALLERELDRPIAPLFDDWRPGDQQVYVSDIRRAQEQFGWEPRVDATHGVRKLAAWARENQALLARILGA